MSCRLVGDCRDDDECHIVDRLGVAAKSSQCVTDCLRDLFRASLAGGLDCLSQSLLAELFAGGIRHFPNAVGSQNENLARMKRTANMLLVNGVLHDSQRHRTGVGLLEAFCRRIKDYGRIVPGVYPAVDSLPEIQDSQMHGHEPTPFQVGGNHAIQSAH